MLRGYGGEGKRRNEKCGSNDLHYSTTSTTVTYSDHLHVSKHLDIHILAHNNAGEEKQK